MIDPSTGVGDYVMFDLVANKANTDNFVGTYTISDSLGMGTGVVGYIDYDGYMAGCWYYRIEDGENMSSYAPMVDGWIEVVDNLDGTITIEFDAWDDADYNITGSWTGVCTPVIESLSVAKKTSKATKNLVIAEDNARKCKADFRRK